MNVEVQIESEVTGVMLRSTEVACWLACIPECRQGKEICSRNCTKCLGVPDQGLNVNSLGSCFWKERVKY